ncbi:MAG TPA: hypothetical protein VN604_04010 [Nitrospirota bacterium]|nr:hypothetical protein [Nitrospirota bacterium]
MHQSQHADFPITCSCGRSYSREAWKTLQFDGVQTGFHEMKHYQFYEDLEMRRCLCGSTMALPVKILK